MLAVLVAAAGYFVDLFDMVLYGSVRNASLRELGVAEDQLLTQGVWLLNLQMAGMLLGGLFWGVLGDRNGRVAILFGSILTYSLANVLNAFVTSVELYAVLRFFAGLGLAGELGGAVTLVSETLGKERRSLGTTMVVAAGTLGALAAGLAGELLSWRICYFLGGLMGLALLVARAALVEPELYKNMAATSTRRGSLTLLFLSRRRLVRYLRHLALGGPVLFVGTVLLALTPELGLALHVPTPVTVGKAGMSYFSGLFLGNIAFGALSNLMKSRKKVLGACFVLTGAGISIFFSLRSLSAAGYYGCFFGFGITTGFWVVYISMIAEQFGTNLRATAATSIPNLVRGSIIFMMLVINYLEPKVGFIASIWLTGMCVIVLAAYCLAKLEESYNKDLDFLEEDG